MTQDVPTGVSVRRSSGIFGAQLKELRETAGFTQEELAAIAGLSVHAISALERGERRRPQVETVRALCAALDLAGPVRDALQASARGPARAAVEALHTAASIPVPPTVLLGREADLLNLSACLAEPDVRLVTITGPGGVGKTRLALELARGIAEKRTRVLFVALASIRSPSLVAPAIAEALGVVDATAPDLPGRARVACDGTATVLILDNFEHVMDAAPLVADLLATVEALRIVATSRAPLRVRGEREYALGPLALETNVETLQPADLGRSPAVHLFMDRARDVRPDIRLTSANLATVTAICQRLDALPLALELAASWIKVLTPEDILRRLARDVLGSPLGARDLPERQQTINATVAWSYQLLGRGEQHVFRRFGALPARFSIDAAVAVLAGRKTSAPTIDAAVDAAAGLIDKSLLVRVDAPAQTRPMFQMLETVRAYATMELTARGEFDEASEGLARYCADEAFLASHGLFGAAQAEWLDRVRDDLESYRAALTWLIERGRPTEAADIAWGLMALGDPRPRRRRLAVVRTDSDADEPPSRSGVESAGRRRDDVVLARRTHGCAHQSHARPPAGRKRPEHRSDRAGRAPVGTRGTCPRQPDRRPRVLRQERGGLSRAGDSLGHREFAERPREGRHHERRRPRGGAPPR